MVTISKFNNQNPRYINLLKRRSNIPAEVEDYLNIKNYLKISGSQGLAAVAYGTDSISKVDAITGPGNSYTQIFCGTNHILPTCGTAKFSSGMSMGEFMRGYSVVKYTEIALKKNADYIIQLAESEGMKAHALAVKVRK